jgi:hypothetical protein
MYMMEKISTKDLVKQYIDQLPEGMTIEEITYRIYFEEQLRKARDGAISSKLYSQAEAKEILKKWLT